MELTLLANKQTEEFAHLGYTATNVNSGVLHEAGERDVTHMWEGCWTAELARSADCCESAWQCLSIMR